MFSHYQKIISQSKKAQATKAQTNFQDGTKRTTPNHTGAPSAHTLLPRQCWSHDPQHAQYTY